ncbi:hypothetical protein AQUCO_01000020v1 [Aquilegia coerulea]|uniref:Symplekin C-terminal domain-containing protein n=1 Tax=Aquilegia coerulea TaxID=218851 RepID=A0A2G5E7X5_AQUCA|nr:hypothetical protein AQUCO_01000020v1 [Aquilegia coerulea]
MAGATREQGFSLLSAAKNHGDLAVKLSSLKQAKEILLSMDSSVASELFPLVVELQSSSEVLVRKFLVELAVDLGLKVMEHSPLLMPILLALIKDNASVVVRQSIVSCTYFFCSCLEEMALQSQFHQSGKAERWMEDLWRWMIKLKDAIIGIALEPGSVGVKLLAIKFLEMCVLSFSADTNDFETSIKEGRRQGFNISWLAGGHPVLDPNILTSEGNKCLGHLLDMFLSATSICGSQIIAIINCLAAIARKRPLHYTTVLSRFLCFDPNFETPKGGHSASIQYSLRTAFLGFLRCTHPVIIESREKLLRALRAMNAGDAADQVIRKVDKMVKNCERASRDCRYGKEDQLSNQVSVSGDLTRKRPMFQDSEGRTSIDDLPAKRPCYGPAGIASFPVQPLSDSGRDDVTVNGTSPKMPFLDGDLTPAEQMIAMIGALLAEGERGAASLEILISSIHPDLMADIVIANMKHLPKSCPPLSSKLGNKTVPSQALSSSTPPFPASAVSLPASAFTSQVAPLSSSTVAMKITSELTSTSNPPADLKRDPRRDPRRLDPRLVPSPVGVQSIPVKEDIGDAQSGFVSSMNLNSPKSLAVVTKVDDTPGPLTSKTDVELSESSLHTSTDQLIPVESMEILDDVRENNQGLEDDTTLDVAPSPLHSVDQDQSTSTTDFIVPENFDAYGLEDDQYSVVSSTSASEEIPHDLPSLPLYVEMTEEQKQNMGKLAVERIFESYKQIQATGYGHTRMTLLAHLVAQTDADADADIVSLLQKHTILDYQEEKGHELALYVLYYLHTIVVSASDDQSFFAATIYEKFLLAMAKSLWDKLPSSDKSFSRFLGEVPLLPESAFKLLEDLCYSDGSEIHERDVRDVDRVTQGLGAVWSLILGRPLDRKACLNIALRCAVHPQDDLRTKAIRLVANKLYPLGYMSESIEQFATDMLLSVVDEQVSDADPSQVGSMPQRMEGNVGVQETSVSGSQNSEPGASENDSTRGNQQVLQSVTTVSMSHAQRQMSLFFSLCTKKPSLLQLVFDIYGRAPKIIKQAVHRHIPILLKNLGSSYSELLRIISDPPQGSENLLMLVLKILTEETAPSPQLISTVKSLYETKLKDAAILIPMLSLLSKDEVLPIFARLVDLPLEKFQAALARILQGSAHTGPALTPAEVLVAIHDINPEKDRIALKKVTDACSACFEQRTVFTQHVLAKALNQLVEQTPLPLLFMRTVIQAIDAFPSLVDFVMEILSKLVNRQIWKMPKLWVGFLKCASQTQPHSFRVLLQLPPPQLEGALTRHANLRGPLAAYANQPSIKSSLPRSILVILGLANESHTQRSFIPSALHATETSSSVQGATLT